MTLEGMGECLAVEGATTAAVFEAYIEEVLLPNLQSRQLVVMDNLSLPTRASGSGNSLRARAVSCSTCHRTRQTSAPSKRPPIEEAFSKVKGLLRKAQVRSREALG